MKIFKSIELRVNEKDYNLNILEFEGGRIEKVKISKRNYNLNILEFEVLYTRTATLLLHIII